MSNILPRYQLIVFDEVIMEDDDLHKLMYEIGKLEISLPIDSLQEGDIVRVLRYSALTERYENLFIIVRGGAK